MRKNFLHFCTHLCCALLTIGLWSACSSERISEPLSEEETKSLPNDWMYSQRAYPHNQIDQQAYREAFRQTKRKRSGITARNGAGSWELAGPINVGGRITDIALHPTDQSVIYAGTSVGGVFKTEDGGTEWEPIFEEEGAYSIGNIAVAPSEPNIVYVGTGEANASFSTGAFFGDGVFKSTDNGDTWEHMGLENTNHIGRIAVDPADADRVFVAAAGVLYGTSEERGIYRTLDGGENWERVLFLTDSTAAIDVVVNPLNANIVYAAMWERIRRPWGRSYGGMTSRIYRSIDGGNNWEQLTNGLPADNEQTGRIGLAISPSEPSILYASYTTNRITNVFNGIYKSEDAGASWNLVVLDDIDEIYASFGWFFGELRVNPNDPDDLFCLGVPLYRSTNGGEEWNDNTNAMHVDFHALEYHPQNTDFVVAGNDGGVYISQNGGTFWDKVETIPNNLIYNMAVDFQQPERIFCGLQDQGTQRTTTGSLDDFERILGGDGFHCIVDPIDNNFVYAEFQFGVLFRSSTGGDNMEFIFSPNDDERSNWNTPVILDPSNPATIYYGANVLYQSKNRGDSWSSISPDLTDGQHPSGTLSYGTITAIAVSPTNSDVIYVGTDDGNVQVTFNEGEDWTNVSDGLPDRFVTEITVHPEDFNTAYVTLSGFRNLDYQPHVLRTVDGGENWEDVSANLPEIPINDIVIDPEQPEVLYIGNDLGVWYSVNEGESWETLGDNFPFTIALDLVLHKPTETLYAATFGRSMHKIDVTDIGPTSTEEPENYFLNELKISPNPVNASTRISFEMPRTAKGQLQVLSLNGQLVETISNQEFFIGKNTFEWDASGLSSGTYIVRLQTMEDILVSKIIR